MNDLRRTMVGQSLMLTISGYEAVAATRDLLAATRAGGVILFAGNIASPAQLHMLCADLQAQAAELGLPPLLIAVDQEGGVVSRLPQPFAVTPSQQALGATGDPQLAYAAARLTGEQLRAHGVNMNFAPVLDVGDNPRNPIVGTRAFSAEPQQVARFAAEALRGYHEAGVIATVKHFPGHGDTVIDSHLGLPVSAHDRARLDVVELLPFRSLLAAGAPAVMTAHMVFLALDDRPATLSAKILRGLLRGELGYDGLIVSDALDMRAIAHRYGAPQAGVLAKQAGIDLLLPMGDAANQVATAEALAAALTNGQLQEADFLATTRRMDGLRRRYDLDVAIHGPSPISSAQTLAALDLARRCLTVDDSRGLLPLVPATDLLVIDCLQPRFNNVEEAVARADLLRGMVVKAFPNVRYTALLPDDEPAWDAALAAARSAPVTALVSRNAVFVERQARLVSELHHAANQLIHLAARSAYDASLTPGSTHLLTYGDQPLGLQAAVERLVGGEVQR